MPTYSEQGKKAGSARVAMLCGESKVETRQSVGKGTRDSAAGGFQLDRGLMSAAAGATCGLWARLCVKPRAR